MKLILFQTFASFFASFGFGIIFNIKGKKLIFASMGGALSWFCYSLLSLIGFSNITALLGASITLSIYAEICARSLKTPVTTCIVTSLIPLVPGAGMYYTMYEAVNGNVSGSLEIGLTTLASSGTLVIGIIFVSTIMRLFNRKK